MAKVFLSHSSKDKPFVRMLAADIKASAVELFIDEVALEIGDSLIVKIAGAIMDADFVVACLSEHSIESQWVRRELDMAMKVGINEKQVIVLPILIPPMEPGKIPRVLRGVLYADMRAPKDYDDGFRQMLRRINPAALPEIPYAFSPMLIGCGRCQRLVEAAKEPEMTDWVVDFLLLALAKRKDPEERRWACVALGMIGGNKAAGALQCAVSDGDETVRGSAQRAMQNLASSQERGLHPQAPSPWGRPAAALLCAALVLAGLLTWPEKPKPGKPASTTTTVRDLHLRAQGAIQSSAEDTIAEDRSCVKIAIHHDTIVIECPNRPRVRINTKELNSVVQDHGLEISF